MSGLPYKIGNKLCKEHDINPTEPSTVKGKWDALKKSALKYSASDETPIDLFYRAHKMDVPKEKESGPSKKILQRPADSKPAKSNKDVDDLAKMLSDLQIQQLEAQQQMT